MFLKVLYYFLMAASLILLFFKRKRLDRRLLLFIPLLFAALLPNGLGDLLGENHWLTNFFFSIYTPLEYTLLSLVIVSYLNNKRLRRLIRLTIPVFIVCGLIIHLYLKQWGSFYEYLDIYIESPLICTWTIFYLFQLANDRTDITPAINPMFLISVGNLFFYSVSAVAYGFGAYFRHIHDTGNQEIMFWIARIANLILYLFYILAFIRIWLVKKY